ncbi:MAG: F0F1 ATP synthase subunit B [Chloroflexi bacterium]|nr:F0F1 ATP synthase subunit B [Chloroflexota bacterium]MBV9892905.1 F0F1 ATP synthase subunit B [Chloroflexota bacterium]
MEAITGTLGLNWQGLIWHAVNFLVLFLLLRQFLFKPVVGMLDARAQRVRESMEQADQARRAAEQAEADRQALLAETRREAEQIRSRADEQAKRILADAEARAHERQQQIESQAEASARQIEERVMAQVRLQLADLVVTAVDRVTRGAVDANAQRGLVQQFLTTNGSGVGVDRAS